MTGRQTLSETVGIHFRRSTMLLCLVLLGGCGAEKRAVGPSPPSSPPSAAADARAGLYKTNAYQLSEGGRMFRWQGCGSCHTETSVGAALLTDHAWKYGGSVEALFASISAGRPQGMPAYVDKVAVEQIWQLAGYVHSLQDTPANKRARQDSAQKGEPEGDRWQGALQ